MHGSRGRAGRLTRAALGLLAAGLLGACASSDPGGSVASSSDRASAAPAERRVAGARVVSVSDRSAATGPRVLAVVAHPDDEIAFAGTFFKTAMGLDGACDVLTITNGEGGYKYSTLAERLYGLPLTDEAVGRAELPAIRERELAEGLGFLAIRDLYLLGQQDHRYTQDESEILEADVWDLGLVHETLVEVMRQGDYDILLTHYPRAGTHGHHKSASILALRAWQELPADDRPAPLGVRLSDTSSADLEGLPGRPLTPARTDVGPWRFDRLTTFGHQDRLDYRIVVNWAIAAHKSQGTMQRFMGRGEHEDYVLYTVGTDREADLAATFFADLAAAPDPGDELEASETAEP